MSRDYAPRRCAALRGIAGFLCLAVLLTSCVDFQQAVMPEQGTPSSVPTATRMLTATAAPTLPVPAAFDEAPALAAMVKSGSLAPVSRRLPNRPKVVAVTSQVGRYGGDWRMVIQPVANDSQFLRTVAYEPLVRWTGDWSGLEPNLVEKYAVNGKATQYTFTLRKGVRWSDGEPFTTRDIRFWYEDILLDKDLTPVIPSWLKSHDEAARFEFVDDYTFVVRFSYPNSLFLQQLATPDALMITAYPEHYIRQFLPKYASAADISQRVSAGKYASWVEMFIQQVGVNSADHGNFIDPARPRLSAWTLQTPYTPGAAQVIWQRNPYYWKVDAQGHQLPYIDRVVFTVVKNLDEVVNRVVAGDIDMQNLNSLGADIDAALGSMQNADYNEYNLANGSNNLMVINLNLASQDATKREIFRNKDFRVGLSYAINRQEMLNFLYHGKGKAWQAAPLPDSPFYDPDMGTQFTEYNPDQANHYLDSAGFRKDQVGHRLGPDGLPISFSVEVLESAPQQIAMLNMIAKYWSEVGIDMQPKIEQLPIYLATVQSNMHDAAAWTGGATMYSDVMLDPSNYLPSNSNAFWAVTWANWYNHIPGYENEQADKSARASTYMYDQIRTMPSQSEQMRLMKGALVIARESFWTIGIAAGPDQHGLIRKNFMNVPARMPAAWLYPDPAPTNPEQYFIAPVK